jgi:predicted ATPase/two-component sensor histidine kinase
MMRDISSYEFTKLWEDGEFVLSRGARAGADTLLAWAPASRRPTPKGMARLERALSLRDELDPAWAARPLELVDQHGKPTLLSEDPGADVLARHVGRAWSVDTFLRVAVGIAAALRQLHARGLVHKDITPASVLVDVSTGDAWLTGFGIASRVPRERPAVEPPEVIAGTLPYMAPEQTGRMNRSIDSRSDLYALGVVLYELLTGALPFSAQDPVEWVHCHVARAPVPVQSKVAAVPGVLADIVAKLLSKTAEERYQTAAGVEYDLRRALEDWSSSGRIGHFSLGSRDASDRLLLSERLFGREVEIGVLLSSFDRVIATGKTELVLVSGYSGIGKSAVVNELHKVLVAPRGLFASGKFDQYKRDIPYATLAEAFRGLMRQLLGKPYEEIEAWREKLVAALGQYGQLIVNLAPELELVIGEQPAVPDVAPKDAQARFQTVVRGFLSVFARREHPLALFLDDLQWLDPATLDLLEHLLRSDDVEYLLLIGAYRDNEVGPEHPLHRRLEELRADSKRVCDIVLSPLRTEDIAALCADALRVPESSVLTLAELVREKTAGNPFFAIQFITALVDEGLLAFDIGCASWRWDVDAIRAKGFTDNIADLMAIRLHRLPERTRDGLRQLACLGNSVRVATLSLILGVPEASVHEALWDVVHSGLVLRTSYGYAFLHDRVHEASYAMLPEGERAAAHLRIANALTSGMPRADIEENVFEIVTHLDRGAALLEAEADRDGAADLYRIAATHARSATANAAAHAYATAGRALLGLDPWARRFRLTFALEMQIAECEFLTGDLHRAEERLEKLSTHAVSPPDRAAVIYLQTILYTAMADRTDRAIGICLEYLRHVGIAWDAHPSPETVREEYETLLTRIGGRSIDELIGLPLLSDADREATLDVLLGLLTPAFNSDQGLVSLVLCKMANLSLEHGIGVASPLGFAFLGMALGCAFGDYRTGYLFGQLALELVENRGITRYRGRVHHTLGTHVLAWTQPFKSAEPWLRRGVKAAQAGGDVTYEAFGYVGLVTNLINSGASLESVQAEAEAGLAVSKTVQFEMGIDHFTGHLRLVRALRGLMDDPCTLDDGGRRFVGELSTCWFWIRTMQACFIYGDYSAALDAAGRCEPLIAITPGFFELPEFHYFAALTKAAPVECASADAASTCEALRGHRAQLSVWAEHCPANFENRVTLVDAEIARIEGRPLEAMDAYERAIRSAREGGVHHYEAIAAERAARFHAARGFETIARAYTQNARAGYLRWGAVGKVEQLDRAEEGALDGSSVGPRSGLIEAPSVDLDLATVVRTSQAVTAEATLEKLIETLMVLAIEHAGAQRGLLVRPQGKELRVDAEATTAPDGSVLVTSERGDARHPRVPESVVQYVSRTREVVLLDDARAPHAFTADPYIRERNVRSVVCVPLVKQTELVGVLYLENNLAPRVFSSARVAVLELLASLAATSLDNAWLERENASLAEKESLLREVHHRVKNNLQLISSMLSLQAHRVTDPAVSELFAESRNRVRSMALVHDNLYRAGNFARIAMASHVSTLCAQLARAYGLAGQRVELTTAVSDVHLEMSQAVSCGLIINELVSNSLKHAFEGGRPGTIRVELRCDDGTNVLTVADNGVGLAAEFDFGTTNTLGLRLVRDLTEQLHGKVAIARGVGTTFTIAFRSPAPR